MMASSLATRSLASAAALIRGPVMSGLAAVSLSASALALTSGGWMAAPGGLSAGGCACKQTRCHISSLSALSNHLQACLWTPRARIAAVDLYTRHKVAAQHTASGLVRGVPELTGADAASAWRILLSCSGLAASTSACGYIMS